MEYGLKNKFSIVLLACIGITMATTISAKKLKVGDNAPEFTLTGDDGKEYSLPMNKKVVVYFYPLDESRDCTKQGCSLARSSDQYKQHGIEVFGVNHQSVAEHAAFKENHSIPFILLSDPDSKVSEAYGTHGWLLWLPWFTTKRKTFLIDHGKIVAILGKDIDVNNHGEQVLREFGIEK